MKTLIAIPCMDMVHTKFMVSLLNLKKTEDTFYAPMAGSLIYDSRNMFAAKAIDGNYDRVLYVDSDMVFASDMLNRLNTDMDEHKLEYVCGLFFKRKAPTSPVIYKTLDYRIEDGKLICAGAVTYHDYPRNALFRIQGSGMGAVLVKTQLLKDVWEKYGPPFDPMTQYGEDLSFCWRVNHLGRGMWCDSSINVGHIGNTVFSEETYLAQTPGYQERDHKEA